MRIFLTGATGFIGSALIQELTGAGHRVIGLARSAATARSIVAAGGVVHRGSLNDTDSLKRGAGLADGVIHTAFIHQFSNLSIFDQLRIVLGGLPGGLAPRFMTTIAALDKNAIIALGSAFVGTDRPLVIASGTLVLPLGRLVNETDLPDLTSPAGYRLPSEATVLALASQGVRASLVRLPPTVHGVGDHGFLPSLITIARKKGVSAYVAQGKNYWPSVHRLDAVRLFRLALENGSAGGQYHGVAEEGIPFQTIASVIGNHLGLPVDARPPAHFGFLGPIVAADNPTSSALTQEQLSWQPQHTPLIADLDQGHYFAALTK